MRFPFRFNILHIFYCVVVDVDGCADVIVVEDVICGVVDAVAC